MRSWRLVFASLTLFTGIGHAQDTAYAALRTVGSSRGDKSLSQVLAVSGEATNTQPTRWKICIDDPAARGGVRELEVSGNQITSERTPVKSEWAGAKDMNLAQLNVDSDGAFKTANQEAKAKGIEFSKVQYQLTVDRGTGKPGWTIQVSDGKEQRVGAVKINADSGTLVSSTWGHETPNLIAQQRSSENNDAQFLNSPEAQPPAHHTQEGEGVSVAKAVPVEKQAPPRYAQEQEQEPPNNSGEQPESGNDRAHRYANGAENFGVTVVNRIERPFLRAGGWIQKKVTGKDTISPPRNSSRDDDDDDNRSADQYNKPVHPVPE
jgi:hypothetical protein